MSNGNNKALHHFDKFVIQNSGFIRKIAAILDSDR